MSDDLFAAAAEDRLTRQAPLAARLRPRTLDDVVGQEHLLGPGRPLRALIEADRLSSVILWGPPGTGKTSLSQLIAHTTSKDFEQLSAVTATVKGEELIFGEVYAEVTTEETGKGGAGDNVVSWKGEVGPMKRFSF